MARIPHPLAGKTGEGPPIAPPNWKWRAGNRISDMYFYSPSGKQFRSRPELANYLPTLDNPPDANLFCWRVTDEVLKNGYVPRDDVVIPKAAKRKAQSTGGGGNKRLKNSTGKLLARRPVSFVTASDITLQSTKVESTALFAPSVGPNSPQRGTMFSSPTYFGHQCLNGRDRPKGKRVRVSVPHSFKSILAGRSSFKWLYDSDTLEKFLEEARRLKNRSAAEINETRNVLLERHLDMNNICKYPNSAIRVFVRLLRNEEAPRSMGKIELVKLCVNWKCKKRHYWCLLEVGRMNSPRKFTKVDDVKSGGGLWPSKGSVSHGEGVGFRSEYGNTHSAVEKSVTGRVNGFLEQPGRTSMLDVRLPDNSGNVVGNGESYAAYSEIGPDSVGGLLDAEDLSGSEKAFLRQAERTAVSHGNDRILHLGFKDETERTSEPFSLNVVQRDPSLDGASSSEAIGGLPLRVAQAISEEPVLSVGCKNDFPADAGFRRQAEATKMMPQNDSQFVLPAGRAPDLYGESIVVITGFKSCASKGTGIVYHGNEAAQLNGGSFARDNCPFASASGLPSTSCSKCKPGEVHCRASVTVINALDGITKRNGSPEPDLSSKDGLLGGFPGLMKSEAMDLTSRVDKRLQEPASNFSNLGGATFCQETESRWNPVQGSFHREERQRSGSSASALDVGGPFDPGDLSMTLSSPDVMKLRMVNVTQTPTLPANVDVAAFLSNDPAPQSLPTAVKQEPSVPQNGDVSPTANDARQVAHFSEARECERDEGATEEHLNNCSREENFPLTLNEAIATTDSLACWCKICVSDFSFCRGCMCSFCRKVLQPREDGTVIKCICGHVCHMDCALAAKAAGVVKELGLDGELSCPSCSRKVDLWLFFQQRFDLILSLSEVANVNLKGVEKLLLQALQLVEGTEKIKYKFIEGLVIESYELIKMFPVLALVQILLRAVRDELHSGPSPDAETLEGGLGANATAEAIDWLKDEHLAWESFNNAKNERLLMEQVVNNVHNAYSDAVNKRKQARSAPRAMMIRETERLKDNANCSVLEELLISQQAKVDQELKKLWDMRKFEAGDFTTISALDASASAWIESLKLQRVVVEAARAKLQQLENLRRQSIEP